MAESTGDSGDRSFAIRPRTAAYWTGGLFLAALAGLVISLVTDDGSDLATTALILAIIAFGLQIVFFAGQLWVANEQDRRSAELYSETAALLAEINASSGETVGIIKEQFKFVLDHALAVRDGEVLIRHADGTTASTPAAVVPSQPDAVSEPQEPARDTVDVVPLDVDELSNRIQRLEARTARQSTDLVGEWERIGSGRYPTTSEPTDWYATFRQFQSNQVKNEPKKWPDAEAGAPALDALTTLSASALEAFKTLTRRWRNAAREGKAYSGYVVTRDDAIDELKEAGLVEMYRTRNESGRFQDAARWTKQGAAAARLLTATGEAPNWVADRSAQIDALGPLDDESA